MSAPRFGLACAGGVVEGAFYEIGVLCALEDAIEGLDLNAAHVYVGVSAGAILTACLANGIPSVEVARAMLSEDASPDGLPPDAIFVPAFGEYGRRAARAPATAARAVVRHFAHPRDISLFGALLELATALPVGLFDSAPLERHLRRVFSEHGRTNDFRELATTLRVMAVNLDSSELVAFGDGATDHVPISKAVQASTALPLIYCPVEIDGEYYIDGVARKTLNASRALQEDVDLLVCVNPIVPIDLRITTGDERYTSLAGAGLPAVLSQTFRTVIHSRMITGFRNYAFLYPDADVILIEPELGDHSMFFTNIFSFANRYEVVRHGFQTARGYLLRNAEALEPVLTRHGLRLRRDRLLSDSDLTVERRQPPRTADVLDDAHDALDSLAEALERFGGTAA